MVHSNNHMVECHSYFHVCDTCTCIFVENKVWLISPGGASAGYPSSNNPVPSLLHVHHQPRTPQSSPYSKGILLCVCVATQTSVHYGYGSYMSSFHLPWFNKPLSIYCLCYAGGPSQFYHPLPVHPRAPYHQLPQTYYGQLGLTAPHMHTAWQQGRCTISYLAT